MIMQKRKSADNDFIFIVKERNISIKDIKKLLEVAVLDGKDQHKRISSGPSFKTGYICD